eukprot:5824131-Amphidinium_carterae.1
MESTPALQSIAMFSAVWGAKDGTGCCAIWNCIPTSTSAHAMETVAQWEIIKRYMRTTFFLDIILTTLDWSHQYSVYCCVMSALGRSLHPRSVIFLPTSQTGPNVRMIKLIRTAKIFRLARVWEVVENLVDNYAPEGTSSKLIIRLGQARLRRTSPLDMHVVCVCPKSEGDDQYNDLQPHIVLRMVLLREGQSDQLATYIVIFPRRPPTQASGIRIFSAAKHNSERGVV